MTNKRFLIGMLVMTVLFGMTVVGCEEDEIENKTEIKVPAISDIVINQKAIPSSNRELIDVGYNENQLVFTHKIGKINNAFVGFFTFGHYYNGVAEDKIEFSRSTAIANAEIHSVTNIKSNTITNEATFSASVGAVIKIIEVGADLSYKWSKANTSGIEITYGRSVTTQISNTSAHSFTLKPEMGAGRYAIIGIANYAIYQMITIDINTKQIIGKPVIFFAVPVVEPEMNVCLVKGDNESFSLADVVNGMAPTIPLILDITQAEINEALILVGERSREYVEIWGNRFTQDALFLSTNWHKYEKLDTFLEPAGGIIGRIPIEALKAEGFKKFNVKLDYSWSSNERSNIEMSFKFVNKTTGEQFGEISNTSGSFIFGGSNGNFDISKLKSGETIVIDIRHKKKNAWGGGGITIDGRRMYTITFEK